jgi:regulatory protein
MAKRVIKPADYALKMLGIKDYSEHELRLKMETKGFTTDEIEPVLLLLKEKKFINDAAYIQKIIEKYTVLSPSGREFIKQKLEEKGIAKERFEGLLDERNETEAAKRAFRMKFKNASETENPSKTRQKAANYLLTKGFDYDIIENILNSEIKGGIDFE